MKRFYVEVDAVLVEKKERKSYGYIEPEIYEDDREVLEYEIYEAITKYLQVKGFAATCVKIENADKDRTDDPEEG